MIPGFNIPQADFNFADQIMQLKDFDYNLPPEKIAQYPLSERADSKLLLYEKGKIQHTVFNRIFDCLPPKSHLVLNDTKVIPARFRVAKQTGAMIEIFLLNPVSPSKIISEIMSCQKSCLWECMIGNKKRWKHEVLSHNIKAKNREVELYISLRDRNNNIVEFNWDDPGITFAEIVEFSGQIPLPPYLNREATSDDKTRYQTVYSKVKGAVAAPTAGLHFTDAILSDLKAKGVSLDYLTLHVGAGTFLPVTSDNVQEHEMHKEQVVIKRDFIEGLVEREGPTIAVGTTSMRSLESLYWYGVQLLESGNPEFRVSKNTPYEREFKHIPSRKEALEAIVLLMKNKRVDHMIGETGIYIYPGYHFQVCDGLITNFHQPKSSLILLVAALIGKDWQKVYREALEQDYRFLSYGDSSLLLP